MARKKINVLSLTIAEVNWLHDSGVDLELEEGRYAVIQTRSKREEVA